MVGKEVEMLREHDDIFRNLSKSHRNIDCGVTGWEVENTTHLREELRVQHFNRSLDGIKSNLPQKGCTVEKIN